MIHYDFKGRLQYIPGGALSVNMSAWPAAVSGNWWEPTTGSFTVVAAYQAKGAADLASSLINLNSPGTNDLSVFTDAPDFDTETGWFFDEFNNRLASNASTSNKPATYIFRVKPISSSGYRTIIGGDDASGALSVDVANSTNYMRVLNQGVANIGTSTTALTADADSVGAVSYSGAGAYVFYVNGSAAGSGTNNQTLAAGKTLRIGFQDSATQLFFGYILAVAMYSTVLDATQIAEITTNMQAL